MLHNDVIRNTALLAAVRKPFSINVDVPVIPLIVLPHAEDLLIFVNIMMLWTKNWSARQTKDKWKGGFFVCISWPLRHFTTGRNYKCFGVLFPVPDDAAEPMCVKKLYNAGHPNSQSSNVKKTTVRHGLGLLLSSQIIISRGTPCYTSCKKHLLASFQYLLGGSIMNTADSQRSAVATSFCRLEMFRINQDLNVEISWM